MKFYVEGHNRQVGHRRAAEMEAADAQAAAEAFSAQNADLTDITVWADLNAATASARRQPLCVLVKGRGSDQG